MRLAVRRQALQRRAWKAQVLAPAAALSGKSLQALLDALDDEPDPLTARPPVSPPTRTDRNATRRP